MISLESTHPDLPSFITIKSDNKKLTKANISVKFFDDFLDAVVEKKDVTLRFERETGDVIEKVVNADELFTKFCENNWDWAEPGIAFWTRIIEWSLISEYTEIIIEGLNPCVKGDTEILTDEGLVQIKHVVDKPINVWNGYEFSEVIPKVTGTDQEMLHITFSDGSELTCTKYHGFMIQNTYHSKPVKIEAQDLEIGTKLTKWTYPVIDMGVDYDESLMYTKGFYCGDGSFNESKQKPFIWLYSEKMNLTKYLSFVGEVWYDENVNRAVVQLDRRLNFDKDFVPDTSFSVQSRLDWLAGLIDSDGTKNSVEGSIAITSVDRDFLMRVKSMLSTIGAMAHVNICKKADVKEMPGGKYFCQTSHRLTLAASTVRKLIDLGLRLKRVDVDPKLARDASRFITVTNIEEVREKEAKVYCFNEPKNHTGCFNGIVTANCGEQPLPKDGSCLLGSFNYAAYVRNGVFDFAMFEEDIHKVIRGMNEVLDEGIPLHPHEGQREMARKWRFIGVGPMGIADMFIKMGIRFGSRASLDILDNISEFLADRAIRASALLAAEYGPYPAYREEAVMNSPFFIANTSDETKELVKQHGLRNAQILTIAPTGSISTMLGVSGGVEPIFAFEYRRKTESLHKEEQYYMIKTPVVFDFMEENELESVEDLPDYFITADKIPYKERIDIQAVLQKHIDASISSTINLPEDTTVEDIKELYLYAWRQGLKGVTTFRKGCQRDGILTTGEDDQTVGELARGYWKPIAPDTVYHPVKVRTGCGKLKLMVGFSEKENTLQDFYVIKSGLGGCERTIQSLIIAMSGMLRLGGSLSNIDQAFADVGGCTSFSNARCRGKNVSKGNNCGNAILNGIKQYCATRVENEPPKEQPESPDGLRCPDCNEVLELRVGCYNCPSCGFSKC